MKKFICHVPAQNIRVEAKNKDEARQKALSLVDMQIKEVKNDFCKIIPYSQRDYRWRWKKLGHTPFTVGGYGCAITTIAMLSSWYCIDVTPGYLAKELSYNKNGLMYWSSLERIGLKCVKRLRDQKLRDLLDLFHATLEHPTHTLMIEVKYGRGNHWLFATGSVGNNFYGLDPLGGKKVIINHKYTVVGCAVIDRK